MRTLTALAAAFLAAAPGIASAAEPPCLTLAEFTSLAGYTLPSIINGTAQRCATTLAPSAFLRTNGKDLAARYAGEMAKHWPSSKAAFLKLRSTTNADANKLFRDMSDTSLQGILDAMMEGMVSQQIPLGRCAVIDRLVGLLSPLPPQNTAELIAVAVGLGAKTDANTKRTKVGKLSICQD
jgi:hypothetical protein